MEGMHPTIMVTLRRLVAAADSGGHRNSVRVENILAQLAYLAAEHGAEEELAELDELIEVGRAAIGEYRDIARGDYDDMEEYAEARTEAWEALCDVIEECTAELLAIS